MASGPRAKRRRVTVQRAPPTRSRVCARVAKRGPRLSSLCKEAIQITPRLPRAPSSRARINADRASNWPPGPPLRSLKHRPRISPSFKFFPETVALKKPSTGYDAVQSIRGSSLWYKLYSFEIAQAQFILARPPKSDLPPFHPSILCGIKDYFILNEINVVYILSYIHFNFFSAFTK